MDLDFDQSTVVADGLAESDDVFTCLKCNGLVSCPSLSAGLAGGRVEQWRIRKQGAPSHPRNSKALCRV